MGVCFYAHNQPIGLCELKTTKTNRAVHMVGSNDQFLSYFFFTSLFRAAYLVLKYYFILVSRTPSHMATLKWREDEFRLPQCLAPRLNGTCKSNPQILSPFTPHS